MTTKAKVDPDTIVQALAAHPGVTGPELAGILGMGQSTITKHLAGLEAAGLARREPGGRDGGRRVADRWHPPTKPADTADKTTPDTALPNTSTAEAGERPVADGAAPTGSNVRLAPGLLGVLVRDYLAAHAGQDVGATQVGKALGRSQGAVANVLARLEASGEARLVSAKPRRYRMVKPR